MKEWSWLLVLTFLPILALADGQTTRVNISSTGEQSNGNNSEEMGISADGRYVVFSSDADNLVLGDINVAEDIFVHDRQTRQTTRVSVNSVGGQGNYNSYAPVISADGRYVAFTSDADNLVSGDTNGWSDIFVHDRQTGQINRVSVNSAGGQGYYYGYALTLSALSADGRYVAFSSGAYNLVPKDTNGIGEIFVHDQQTGKTTLISINSADEPGNKASSYPVLSADGRYVAFSSDADNLVPGDSNGGTDIFVHDRQTRQTTRVSVNSVGGQGNYNSYAPVISADGRYVAFTSDADNLVSGDTNGWSDIFVHDRQTGQTIRVNVDSAGGQGNSLSSDPTISADGRYVAFSSFSDHLVPGDTNARADIFVHDQKSGQTTRVSIDNSGLQGNGDSYAPAINADGRYVAFSSKANTLVPGDTNGWSDIFVRDRLLQTQNKTDISLVISGPVSVAKGNDAIYKFKVTNNSIINASNVTLTDIISNKGKLKSISTSQGICSRAAVQVCRLGTLGAGKSITVTATVTINGQTTIKATAQSAPQDNQPNNNTKIFNTKLFCLIPAKTVCER